MDAVDVARWQFAITTVYHFLFVPLTIGLSLLVAGMQTAWVRTGDERYLLARDRGPERALVRNIVDSRRTVGTWFLNWPIETSATLLRNVM